ncbi:hypothetical protein Peur_024471 [Populus x canadensis]
MLLKEGYGLREVWQTDSLIPWQLYVMGVVRRHDNVLMIVPPQEPSQQVVSGSHASFQPVLKALF